MGLLKQISRSYKFWRQKRKAALRPVSMDQPYVICNIELTNNCPMKCVMCPRTSHMTRDIGYMDFGLFRSVIDQMVADNPKHTDGSAMVALHHFGESLMHRDLDRFVGYAEGKGIRTDLSVNPIVFSDRVRKQLLDAPPSVLHISLDGHDDESFYAIRGVKNAYQRSKLNLEKYLGERSSRKTKTRIVLNMIAFSKNHESIEKQRNYWKSFHGVDEFCVKEFITWNGDADDINQLRGGNANLPASLTQDSFVSCNRPWQLMTVTWDGDVVPCCYDYDKKEIIGNVRNQSLKEIWNGKPMQDLRQQFISNNVSSKLCKSCDYLLRLR